MAEIRDTRLNILEAVLMTHFKIVGWYLTDPEDIDHLFSISFVDDEEKDICDLIYPDLIDMVNIVKTHNSHGNDHSFFMYKTFDGVDYIYKFYPNPEIDISLS